MANAMISLHARGLAVSYAISTGNEGSVTIVDYMDALARIRPPRCSASAPNTFVSPANLSPRFAQFLTLASP